MANSINDIVNAVPSLQNRPKNDREWNHFVNELAKWIATIVGTLEIDKGDSGANLKLSGTAAANTTAPVSTLTTSGASLGHAQIELADGSIAWIPLVDTPF